MIKNTANLCVLPWTHLFVGNTGRFFPCCMIEHQETYLKDEAGMPLTAQGEDSWERAMNSPAMKEMRQSMLEGKRADSCSKCWALEDRGHTSPRQIHNAAFFKQNPKFFEKISKNSELSSIESVDLRLGNRCNLVCRMCNPETAQSWLKDWEILHPQDLDAEEVENYRDLKWVENFKLPDLPNLKKINFGGGEPLIIPQIKDILSELVESGAAKNMELSFNTNLTVLPLWVQKIFPFFKRVHLMVSLDGRELVNDYIRYPGRFSQVHDHLIMLDAAHENWGVSEVSLLCTVQSYNVLELPEFMKYPKQFNFIKKNLLINFLFDPEALSIQALPAEKKKMVEEIYQQHLKSTTPLDSVDKKNLESVLNFMWAQDLSKHFPEFIRQTQTLDQVRGQSWKNLGEFTLILEKFN